MATMNFGAGKPKKGTMNSSRLDQLVSKARYETPEDQANYREQALRIHPWICGRCGKEFSREDLHLLTVHHKDHNHNNNPADGSNWENLCIYCHDNEHRRHLDHDEGSHAIGEKQVEAATHNPFAALQDLLKSTK